MKQSEQQAKQRQAQEQLQRGKSNAKRKVVERQLKANGLANK